MVLCDGLITVDELAGHSHIERVITEDTHANYLMLNKSGGTKGGAAPDTHAWTSQSTAPLETEISGLDKPHNNLQTSKTVYIWLRTA